MSIAGIMNSTEFQCWELYRVARNNGNDLDRTAGSLVDRYPELSNEQACQLRLFLRKTFLPRLHNKWQKASRTSSQFENDCQEWLNNTLIISEI